MKNKNSFKSKQNLVVDSKNYTFFDIKTVADQFNIELKDVRAEILFLSLKKFGATALISSVLR